MHFEGIATLPEMIHAIGYLGIFLIVFVESGVPFGVFLPLPGDTLLFSAGLLVATASLDIVPLLLVVVSAAVLGDSAGYWFGKKFGPRIFVKESGFFLNKKYLERAEQFYRKHGRSAIIIARFLPILRTIVPISAGVGTMKYSTFLTYNIAGALLWGVGITLLGYFLGNLIPNIDVYLLPILLVILVISSIPIIKEVLNMRKSSARGE